MRDGSILNFPNGNDKEYIAWLKTEEGRTKNISLIFASPKYVLDGIRRRDKEIEDLGGDDVL